MCRHSGSSEHGTANASLCRLRRTALRCGFTSRRVLKDAGGKAPIAQTLDRDLGFVARYLANPRATGDAAVNLQTQCLRGCLRIGRNNNIDEIGHWISPVAKIDTELWRIANVRLH